jgi:adenine-specific DNA-methyltransferase
MRFLFDHCPEGKNFYNDYLEHLFYGSLNSRAEGSSDFYRKHFDCQIPFLNGGLFEPPEDYDWEKSFVHIPNKIFSNKDNTGILDVFDLYNFTIYEDDPIDREVSVDPEMLGKVFENLLPENLRKGQGAYYTPREIVHYMCQESLINYLVPETKVDTDKISDLVVKKHFDEEGSRGAIDRALQNIKVCDPACGSGAFLVGMLHEIVSARCILDPKKDEYHLKKETIQNCIYGVDIDPGAVEIAKLRLWLSLVVDYELKDIEPLPNLDYKLMCGNSLLEEFEGVRFYDGSTDGVSLFKDERKQKIQELREKVKSYFNISDEKEKRKKREEINKLKDWFIKATLEKRRKEISVQRKRIESAANMFEERSRQEYFTTQSKIFVSEAKINEVLRELHNPQKARPFFIWKLEFMDVFEDKGGFDVVIANPPYVGEKGHKELFRQIKIGNLKDFYQGKMDLFYFFFHLSLNIGRTNSSIAFITTNYYPTATGGMKLRKDFCNRSAILRLINFNELKIFESAMGQHNMITLLLKSSIRSIPVRACITRKTGLATSEIINDIISGGNKETDYFCIPQDDLYEGEECYIRLSSDVKQSPINKLLDKIKNQGKRLDEFCNINQGVISGADKVTRKHLEKFKLDAKKGDGIYVLSNVEVEKLNLSKKDKMILKPWFKNSDICRYKTIDDYKESLIFADKRQKNLEDNKAKEHLLKFKIILDQSTSNSPYLHRPRDIDFDGAKIVAPQRSYQNTFGYNEIPWYASADVYFITQKDSNVFLKYILGLLNSKLFYVWLYFKGKRKGELLELYQVPLSEIPIKQAPTLLEQEIIGVVNKILLITESKDYLENESRQSKVKEYERQIDQMVYELYGFTKEEIKIVESFNKD